MSTKLTKAPASPLMGRAGVTPSGKDMVDAVAKETRPLSFNALTMDEHRDIVRKAFDAGWDWYAKMLPTRKAEGNAESGAKVAERTETWADLQRLWQAILGHRPRCRDCADFDGRCQGTGLPCDPTEAAIEVVGKLKAQLAAGAEVAGLVEAALRGAYDFLASEYRDEKSAALDGSPFAKEARSVIETISAALTSMDRGA